MAASIGLKAGAGAKLFQEPDPALARLACSVIILTAYKGNASKSIRRRLATPTPPIPDAISSPRRSLNPRTVRARTTTLRV